MKRLIQLILSITVLLVSTISVAGPVIPYPPGGGGSADLSSVLLKSLGTGKGVLLGFSAANTPGTLAAGTDGDFLVADAASTLGVKWYTAPGWPLPASSGGTGVANNAASTLTISGNYATTLTVSNTTALTLPTSGTVATVAPREVHSTTQSTLGRAEPSALGGFHSHRRGRQSHHAHLPESCS